MKMDEHVVFKCPYETMAKDLTKALGVQVGSFVYFYINLEDAQEIANPKISFLV